MTDSISLPLSALALRLRLGDLTPRAYVQEILRRVEDVEPRIHSLLPETARAERLTREAEEVQRRFLEPVARPPLFGIPVGIKDIFRVRGFETRAGSRLPPEVFEGEQAEGVDRVKAAGGIILGKTVTTEFAYFAPGPTRNPAHPDHTPGGSSSGSAAAVAAGLCPLALGTQTIGSVIRPASFCGIVGFKPSYGRISAAGVIPLAPSLDHVGLFTRDVASAAYAAEVLCLKWRKDLPNSSPRLGIPAGPYLDCTGDIARRRFDEACQELADRGYSLRPVNVMPDFAEIRRRHQIILAAEAARVHAAWFSGFHDLYHPRTAQLIEEGLQVTRDELDRALDGQAELRQALQSLMETEAVDLWVAPSTPGPAPLGLESTGDPIMNLPWTQAGLPAITIPCGVDSDGLPLGLQVIARWNADEDLMSWCLGMETRLQQAWPSEHEPAMLSRQQG